MNVTLQDIQSATRSTHQLSHKSKRSAAMHRLKFAMHRLVGRLNLSGDIQAIQSDITQAQTFPELRHIAILDMLLEDKDLVALLVYAWVEQSPEDEAEWLETYQPNEF